MTKVNRILWMFWAQGFEKAPPVVEACVNTWRAYNPDWDIRLLTRETLSDHLTDPARIEQMLDTGKPIEATSNLLRVELLLAHGGVWADATDYCCRPLSEWIDDAAREGFFAFARPSETNMVASWFLAGHPGNGILRAWRDATVAYWEGREKRHIYFWFHGLFAELYRTDEAFRAQWDRCVKIAARGPHIFTPARPKLELPPTLRMKLLVPFGASPLVKLSWKLATPHEEMAENSAYRWLLSRPEAQGNARHPGLGYRLQRPARTLLSETAKALSAKEARMPVRAPTEGATPAR